MIIIPQHDIESRYDLVREYLATQWFCAWKIRTTPNVIEVTAWPKKHETYLALKYGAIK